MAILDINKQDSKFESNVEMKSKSFGIGDASAIIDILRNRMYSKPIQTLVQEYICNARDAMIEAGTLGQRKIKVVAPTKLACQFRVRDYGVGLSQDRVENIFTMYGNSTKRSSNNQIGGYGLGAKSAWAYTDSFTVVSFYNGDKTTYLCHVGKDNVGSMDVLSKEKTTEANGVEIIVTVKPEDTKAFSEATNRCLTYWDTKTYELNIGLTPKHLIRYDDGFCLQVSEVEGDYYSNQNFIIVDDIIFTLPTEMRVELKKGVSFRVKTGDVDVAPSRESIINNDKLKTLALKIGVHLKKLAGEYETIKDLSTKIEKRLMLRDVLNLGNIDIDKNFFIQGDRLFTNKFRRLTNKKGNVVFDSANGDISRDTAFQIDTSTYVIVSPKDIKFVPSKLEHHLSGKHFRGNVSCIEVESINEIHEYLRDKLTIIDASTLPMPPKVSKATKVKVDGEVRKLYWNGYLYAHETTLSKIDINTVKFKYPYVGFRDDSELEYLLKNCDGGIVLGLKKEDYDASTLPTMAEYKESIAKKERKLIGNINRHNWERLFKLVSNEDVPTFGKEPNTWFLNSKEIAEHEKLEKESEDKIKTLLSKYPLLEAIERNTSARYEEFAYYIMLKQKDTLKQIKKGA